MDCFLYIKERQKMYNLIEHFIPYFPRLNKKQKLSIILNGVDPENQEFISTNITITKSVQEFILSIKRFTVMENKD